LLDSLLQEIWKIIMKRSKQPVKTPGNSSIKSFFAAQIERQEKKVPCPICSVEVLYKQINKHLDDCTQAISTDDVQIIENDGNAYSNGSNKRKLEDQHFNNKRQRKDSETFSDDETFMRDLEGSRDVTPRSSQETPSSSQKKNSIPGGPASFCLEKSRNLSETKQIKMKISTNTIEETTCTSISVSQTIKLSPSISYNPAKYGGINNISPKGAKIIRSTSKTAADKYSPRKLAITSPNCGNQSKKGDQNTNAAKRNLFDGHPEMPQHDPFTPTKRRDPHYVPYYVTNFEYIISCVIDCTDDADLFNPDELEIIEAYRNLPLSARKLYVRLFNRKHAWILESNIKYDECPDVELDAHSLVAASLLQDKLELDDLSESLGILHSPEIRMVAKEFNVSGRLGSKAEIIEEMVAMCSKKTVFQTTNTLQAKVIKRARSLGGNCYRLNPLPRSVLNRVLCLWGVSQWWGEREDDRPPSSLTTLLLANQGRITYPPYNILRERKVFRDRSDLLLFESAVKIEDKIETALANKDFEEGYEVYKLTLVEFERLLSDEGLMKLVLSLPVFLRKLTAPAVLVYALNRSVELLEKSKRHEEAVVLLERLLQTDFLHKYRGFWYERLCLDLDNHLKKPKVALNNIKTALKDEYVRGARRLSLHQRIIKICKAKKNTELEEQLEQFQAKHDWQDPGAQDLTTVVISGKMVSKDGVAGTKSVFMLTDPEGGTTYCNVEELVREHYKCEGLYEGSHAEGAVLNSILALLFWEIIYTTKVPDAFRDPAQSQPLDWDTDDFYINRRQLIDQRILQIEGMSESDVCEAVEAAFTSNVGVCSLVAWDRWRGPAHLLGLVRCIPPQKLARIMERMIKDHRTYRSGLPDLTCWNPDTGVLKFVEVKGPGDRLSYKQILWIRFFCLIGVSAEVCHVDPTGSLDKQGVKKSPKKAPLKKSPKKAPLKKSPKKSPLLNKAATWCPPPKELTKKVFFSQKVQKKVFPFCCVARQAEDDPII